MSRKAVSSRAPATSPCRNEPGLGAHHPEDPIARRDHPLEAPAALEIDEGITAVEERVAQVDDVGADELDDGVAVGVGVGHVPHHDRLAVPVERDVGPERDDRQRHGRRLLGPAHHVLELGRVHPAADVVVGHDQRAGLAEVLVAAGVVAVPVGVHHEPDRLRGHGPNGGQDLLGQRGELIVDDEGAVIPHRKADVAALSEQHVEAGSERHGPDLDRVPVGLLLLREQRSGQGSGQGQRHGAGREEEPHRGASERGW